MLVYLVVGLACLIRGAFSTQTSDNLFVAGTNLTQMLFIAENSIYRSKNVGLSWEAVGGVQNQFWLGLTSDQTGQHLYGTT